MASHKAVIEELSDFTNQMIFGDRGIEVVVFRAVKNKLVEVSRSYVANAPRCGHE
jgi:hypothetical protein